MDERAPERETRRQIRQDAAALRRATTIGLDEVMSELRVQKAEIEKIVRRNSRKRPPGMAPALVEPPRGPKPFAGGAAASLEFD